MTPLAEGIHNRAPDGFPTFELRRKRTVEPPAHRPQGPVGHDDRSRDGRANEMGRGEGQRLPRRCRADTLGESPSSLAEFVGGAHGVILSHGGHGASSTGQAERAERVASSENWQEMGKGRSNAANANHRGLRLRAMSKKYLRHAALGPGDSKPAFHQSDRF